MADESEVTRLAGEQHGLVTRDQLRGLGFSPGMLRYLSLIHISEPTRPY